MYKNDGEGLHMLSTLIHIDTVRPLRLHDNMCITSSREESSWLHAITMDYHPLLTLTLKDCWRTCFAPMEKTDVAVVVPSSNSIFEIHDTMKNFWFHIKGLLQRKFSDGDRSSTEKNPNNEQFNNNCEIPVAACTKKYEYCRRVTATSEIFLPSNSFEIYHKNKGRLETSKNNCSV
jgi:hypothetical protein